MECCCFERPPGLACPQVDPFTTWQDNQWTEALVDRFLNRGSFPDESLFLQISKRGRKFLHERFRFLNISQPVAHTMCLWNDREIFVYLETLGNNFLNSKISWDRIFGLLLACKLFGVDLYCCKVPVLCSENFARVTKRYLAYRLESWIASNGGWRVGVNSSADLENVPPKKSVRFADTIDQKLLKRLDAKYDRVFRIPFEESTAQSEETETEDFFPADEDVESAIREFRKESEKKLDVIDTLQERLERHNDRHVNE